MTALSFTPESRANRKEPNHFLFAGKRDPYSPSLLRLPEFHPTSSHVHKKDNHTQHKYATLHTRYCSGDIFPEGFNTATVRDIAELAAVNNVTIYSASDKNTRLSWRWNTKPSIPTAEPHRGCPTPTRFQ